MHVCYLRVHACVFCKYMYVSVFKNMFSCMYLCMHACMYAYVCQSVCVCKCLFLCENMDICQHVHVHGHVFVHTNMCALIFRVMTTSFGVRGMCSLSVAFLPSIPLPVGACWSAPFLAVCVRTSYILLRRNHPFKPCFSACGWWVAHLVYFCLPQFFIGCT